MKSFFFLIFKSFFLLNLFFFCFPFMALSKDYTGEILVYASHFRPNSKFSNFFNCHNETGAGVSFDVKEKNWPLSIAFESSLFYGESKSVFDDKKKRMDFFRSDTGIGAKKIFNDDSFVRPFIAGGIYLVRMYGKISGNSDTSLGFGFWWSSGINIKVSEKIVLGTQFKYSRANISFFEYNGNSGGKYFELMSGFNF